MKILFYLLFVSACFGDDLHLQKITNGLIISSTNIWDSIGIYSSEDLSFTSEEIKYPDPVKFPAYNSEILGYKFMPQPDMTPAEGVYMQMMVIMLTSPVGPAGGYTPESIRKYVLDHNLQRHLEGWK